MIILIKNLYLLEREVFERFLIWHAIIHFVRNDV